MRKQTRETKKIERLENPTVKVLRAKEFTNTGDVIADIEVNGVRIYGVRVVEGRNGDFLSFPQRKGSDGAYYSIAWCPLADEDIKKILADIEDLLS